MFRGSLADVHCQWIVHYKNGDMPVVETIGLSSKISYIDNFTTPHNEKLHVVEHFTIELAVEGLSAQLCAPVAVFIGFSHPTIIRTLRMFEVLPP